MRWRSIFVWALVLSGCGSDSNDGRDFTQAQNKSWIGPTSAWNLDAALPRAEISDMRNRAYGYCADVKGTDEDCLREQDHSLLAYANAFRLVRIFRSEAKPTFPFAVAHKRDPAAFARIRRHCRSIYEDQGRGDARSLGPCMSAGTGADFFDVLSVSAEARDLPSP